MSDFAFNPHADMDFKVHFDEEGENITIGFRVENREMTGSVTQGASVPLLAALLGIIGGSGWTAIEAIEHHDDGSFTLLNVEGGKVT